MIRYRSVCIASASLALALVACQGESGTGGGLSIPAPQYTNPPGPGGFAASASREQTLDGAVTLSPGRTELPLPSLDGFSVSLELGTPAPSSTPAAASSASPGAAKAGALPGAAARPVPTPSPAPAARPSPAPLASGATVVAQPASASATPSAGPSGAPGAGQIATKTTVYPEDAPVAPSPKPTGDVQTFVKRTPLVRGYLQPVADITLYGLGALRFTIPQSEQTPGRGFTVALYVAVKKHHDELVAADTAPTLADDVVQSSQTSSPLVLKKATAYLVMLYGDQLPPTPAPAGVYPTPGTNPFPTQTPSGQGGFPQQQPGYPQQPGYTPQPGYPQQTPTPTPFP
jgi:hypothetical protein